ncbi:aldo/keto reductase [Lentilactobacillus hilgardii]|jgi:diketogulonate reductase-like aldo/keto reductase|uniref:Aldo/keto reductase n=1 Tax=Lentilactobacillus hilgardii TaxID=1588 RepID=A0A6P1E5Q0_LENHI|nr:aldo/keto reductase [Lentilactobacillus hilgardii]EEI71966.1 oxidoreductase, aldo/keto reductase family protein [Lentilactobacillus hilgardii ATCC 27305]MCT3391033.1 aldo/keto reductase [Lentilactobacillus hilgardii]QHB51102.1 aldo/keto reductase [Lentilactobacillus hilgardii]RRG12080.1 MAG: aldo/keto reductase [Lactobacillus sp.]
MKDLHLGDRTVPAIGLGTWHMGDSAATRSTEIKAIQAGIDAGANVIDTAEMYGNGRSENLVGEAIANINRDHLFLIDKVLPSNASADRMEHRLDISLKLLGTDYVDLYLYHWRGAVPLSETVETLQLMQKKGKIKHWGVSNFDLPDMKELLDLPGGDQVAANEDLYNLGSRGIEYSLLPWQRQQGIPLIAYTPVAAGDERGQLINHSAVKEVAEVHHATPWQILLAWAIRDGSTLAIPQSGDPKHAVDNVKAGLITLSDDDLAKLDTQFPKPTSKQPLDIR